MYKNYINVNGIQMCNVSDILSMMAQADPEHLMTADLVQGEKTEQYTYREMEEYVKVIGSNMRYLGLESQRILIMMPHNSKMIAYLFACFMADAVAIPELPYGEDSIAENIAAKIRNAKVDVIISNETMTDEFIEQVYSYLDEETEVLFFDKNDFESEPKSEFLDVLPEKGGSDLALIQFTSGTSNNPKAVMLSHANVLEGVNKIDSRVVVNREHIVLSVLPLTHNLGLICGLAFFARQSEVLFLNIKEVLANPFLWIKTASRYKVTLWGGINILFFISVKYIPDELLKDIDLSSITVSFVGGEEVNVDGLNAFTQKFGKVGFNELSYIPGYGMTENTLLISATQFMTGVRTIYVDSEQLKQEKIVLVSKEHPNAKRYVSNGGIFDEDRIFVVNPETFEIYNDEDHIGEIWISADSVALGYVDNEEAQKERFGWSLEGYEDSFLRTGDVGFILDKHLYLTGRISDLVIVDGNNFYAADLENVLVRNVPEINAGSCAIFSYINEKSQEIICLVIGYPESEKPNREFMEQIIRKVNEVASEKASIHFDEVVVTDVSHILKTSIGKVKRNVIKKNYCNGTLEYSYLWKDGNFIE